MINHISVGVHNPEKAAGVLAEIWNGYAFPFPPSPGGYIAFADDGRGTTVEFTPINIQITPGKDLEAEENSGALGDEYQASFKPTDETPHYVSTHLALNSPRSEEEIKAIAVREGWRVLTANRGGGLFQLIEVWIENRFMIEVFTPEMTARYVELVTPENWAGFLRLPFTPRPQAANNLNLIG